MFFNFGKLLAYNHFMFGLLPNAQQYLRGFKTLRHFGGIPVAWDYKCVSSFPDISNEYSPLYHMMAYMISQHF